MANKSGTTNVVIRLPLLIKLLLFIRDSGGSVSVREVARRFSWCRVSSRAKQQLQVLVDAGLGSWRYSQPNKAGGRPTQWFVLNQVLPADLEEDNQLIVAGTRPERLVQFMVAELLAWVQTKRGYSKDAIQESLRRVAATVKVLSHHTGMMGGILNDRLRIDKDGAIAFSWSYLENRGA